MDDTTDKERRTPSPVSDSGKAGETNVYMTGSELRQVSEEITNSPAPSRESSENRSARDFVLDRVRNSSRQLQQPCKQEEETSSSSESKHARQVSPTVVDEDLEAPPDTTVASQGPSQRKTTSQMSEGRRALTNSIRHHARILQQADVSNMKLNDPTEQPAPFMMPQSRQLNYDDAQAQNGWVEYLPRVLVDSTATTTESITKKYNSWRHWVVTQFQSDGTNNDRKAQRGGITGDDNSFISVVVSLSTRKRNFLLLSISVLFACCILTVAILGTIHAVHEQGRVSAGPSGVAAMMGGGGTVKSSLAAAAVSPAAIGALIDSSFPGTHIPSSEELKNANIQLTFGVERHFADFEPDTRNLEGTETPYFFHVPHSGGGTMQKVTRQCLGLLEASDAGRGHEEDSELKIFERPVGSGNRFVNVDAHTSEGLDRARQMNLTSSDVVQIFYSPLVQDWSNLFTADRRARMFGFFMHPVDRAVRSYSNSLAAGMEEGDATIAKLTWHAVSGQLENNAVTRLLADKARGELNESDLLRAMETMRRKCLVGLADAAHLKQSLLRVGEYFDWDVHQSSRWDAAQERDGCIDRMVKHHWMVVPDTLVVQEGSELHTMIMEENVYDAILYEYAQQLYREQGSFFIDEDESSGD